MVAGPPRGAGKGSGQGRRDGPGGQGPPATPLASSVEEVLGAVARRNLSRRGARGPQLIVSAPIIQRGDPVIIAVRRRGRIEVRGSPDAGCLGDTIRVRNLQSRKVIQAVATAPDVWRCRQNEKNCISGSGGASSVRDGPRQATARSLWDDRSNWVADRRPTSVGDIVTVVVNGGPGPRTRKADVSKSNNNSVADGVGIFDSSGPSASARRATEGRRFHGTDPHRPDPDHLPGHRYPSQRQPLIEGTRDIATHEETLQLQVVGSSVPRTWTATTRFRATDRQRGDRRQGKGALTRLQKPGILTQILQTIF